MKLVREMGGTREEGGLIYAVKLVLRFGANLLLIQICLLIFNSGTENANVDIWSTQFVVFWLHSCEQLVCSSEFVWERC